MTSNYMEILTKCEKCGKHFSHLQSKECPHKFTDKVRQLMSEGKLEDAQREAQKEKTSELLWEKNE